MVEMVEIENEVEELKKSWSMMPEELLSLIKFNLFAGDFNAFNAVCRSWRSTHTLVRPLPPPIHCPFRSSPCLIYLRRENDMCMFFHPIYNDFFSMDIPELYGAKIHSSKYGWLLVSKQSSIFFFNPFTREKIELPDTTTYMVTSACFASPPTSHDCLVCVFSVAITYTEIGVLYRGQESWDFNTYEYGGQPFTCSDCNPLLFNGKYYVLGISGNLGVFDPNYLSWEVLSKPNELEHNRSFYQSFLCELDRKIMAGFLSHDCENTFCFLSLDLTHMVWQPHGTIGDKMLYASCCSAFFKRAIVNGMGNKIYLPIFNDKNGIFYSLSTKNFHSFAGGDSSIEKEMRSPQRNAWIEPSFESVGHENLTW